MQSHGPMPPNLPDPQPPLSHVSPNCLPNRLIKHPPMLSHTALVCHYKTISLIINPIIRSELIVEYQLNYQLKYQPD